MDMTTETFIMFCMLIVNIIGLVIMIQNKKRK